MYKIQNHVEISKSGQNVQNNVNNFKMTEKFKIVEKRSKSCKTLKIMSEIMSEVQND